MNISLRTSSTNDAAAIATLVGELGHPVKPGEIEARLQLLLDRDRYFLAVAS